MAFHARLARAVRSDINLTPLVDVVLVLLIIFLVAVPVLLRNLAVDIPRRAESDIPQPPSEPMTVEVKEDGALILNGQALLRGELAEKLRTRLATRADRVVFVDVDDKVAYGEAVRVIDTIKGAGAETVALKKK
jgi:biopolymer transport protein ExbD